MQDELAQEDATVAPVPPDAHQTDGTLGMTAQEHDEPADASPSSPPAAAEQSELHEPVSAPATAEADATTATPAPEVDEAAPSGAAAEADATPAEPAPAVDEAAPSGAAGPDAAAFEEALHAGADYDESFHRLREGDVITGTVMRVDREGVLVDVGAKSEGIIRMHELSRDPTVDPATVVQVGQRIKVYVLERENRDGNPILSKKRADFEDAWERVHQSLGTGETIHAMVTDRVKGGLVVDLGIRGFVPASHVGSAVYKANLDRYVGQSIPLKVLEVDKERRKVILSNRLAVQQERRQRSEQTRASLEPGQIRPGVVRRLTNYGAFVDLGGVDGLLHISEMSWTRINDPRDVLKEGQEIEVYILKIDSEANRVSLSLRQILPDPWTEVVGRFREGDVITGVVSRLVQSGAFVQVEGGVEGIIPNSDMPRSRGPRGPSPVNVGEHVSVKIVSLRPDERRMTLSLSATEPAVDAEPETPAGTREVGKRGRGDRHRDESDEYARYAPGHEDEPGFTIGDRLASQRRERSKRDRRAAAEEHDEMGDEELMGVEGQADTEMEPDADTDA